MTDEDLQRIGQLAGDYAFSAEHALPSGSSMGGMRAISLAAVDVLEGASRESHRKDGQRSGRLPRRKRFADWAFTERVVRTESTYEGKPLLRLLGRGLRLGVPNTRMAASEPSDSTASNEGDPVGVARTAGEPGQSRITRDQGVCAEDPRGSSTAAVRSPLKRSTSSAWLRSTASGRLGCVAA